MRTMSRSGSSGACAFWIVHGGIAWPWPRGLHPEEALVPPARLRALPWQDFDLRRRSGREGAGRPCLSDPNARHVFLHAVFCETQ